MSLLVFVLRVETWPSPESIQVQSLVKQSLKLFLYTPYAHILCSTSIWSFAYKSEYYSSRQEIFSKLGWIPKHVQDPINTKTLQYLNDLANNKLFLPLINLYPFQKKLSSCHQPQVKSHRILLGALINLIFIHFYHIILICFKSSIYQNLNSANQVHV